MEEADAMASKPVAGKGEAGPVYVRSNTISLGSRTGKRERSSSPDSSGVGKDHELTQFLHAASINFLWDAVEEYNGTIECSCYSCCAIKFKGADLENPQNRDCALRRAFIERLKDNNCVMFNLIGDDEDEHSSRVVYRKASGSPSFNREETFPETDAHIVELYRRPGFNESFEDYQKSDNFWQISGFAKFICGAMTVEDVHVKRWRDLLMHLYDVRESAHMKATYAVVVPLIKILWPEWEHDVE